MSNEEILTKFRKYLIGNDLGKITIENYLGNIRRLLIWKKKKPETWDMNDLYDIKEYYTEKYPISSRVNKLSAVNNFMKFINGEDTKLKLKIPKVILKNKDILTMEEVSKILKIVKRKPRETAIILTFIHTGIRREELCNLNIDDILWEEKKIKINEGKGNTYDIINIKQEALDSIKAYLEDEERHKPKKEYENALFLSSQGKRIEVNTLNRLIKNIGFKALGKRVYPHLFRATMITIMDSNGASVFEIKQQSRHRQTKTLEGYVRHNNQYIKEIYEKTMPTFKEDNKPQSKPPEKKPTPREKPQDNYIAKTNESNRIKQLELEIELLKLKQQSNQTEYIQ